MYELQLDQLGELHSLKTSKQRQIEQNEQKMKELSKQMDDQFGH
jgi:hypothetical protein